MRVGGVAAAWSRVRRVVPFLLPALTFLSCLVPLLPGINRIVPRVGELAEQAGVPLMVQCGLLAVLAAWAIWATPARWWPLFAVAVVGWVLQAGGPLIALVSFRVAARFGRMRLLAGYAAGATVLTLIPVAPDSDGIYRLWPVLPDALGGPALFVWFPVAVGLWETGRRRIAEKERDRARQAERAQEAKVNEARARERARIARDMHDVVAHRVSLMVLHAGALEVNSDGEVAAAAGLIRTTGQEALAQLREVLGILKPGRATAGPPPRLADLEELVARSRTAGIPVSLRQEGEPVTLAPVVDHTGYRVVQEGLTNVHKHAGAVTTRVTVRYSGDEVEVVVDNVAAVRTGAAMPGSGMGLVGLRERVELLGGHFTAGPRLDGGFTVRARLPAVAETQDGADDLAGPAGVADGAAG
ncbi:sensor histidine kinase [Amycolatopsis suaedae]|uniref:histidine kinase n=1 Tax=Amycolatopsis suaedae TaxID=2510978 RepID=A0A4Q7IZE2_9PSEU|nr:sensor histidine kinase [Amycolatopsis suaedae]RZQ59453.1 two-component sensor histidine kinase [Amycolatopsis suaedae]